MCNREFVKVLFLFYKKSKRNKQQSSTPSRPSEIDDNIIRESFSQSDSSEVLHIHDGGIIIHISVYF